MLTAQEKQAWLAELRDPNNKQIYQSYFENCHLGDIDKIKTIDCMCALGALVKGNVKLDVDILHGCTLCNKVEHDVWYAITEMNDTKKLTFTEIADWVEKNVPTCN